MTADEGWLERLAAVLDRNAYAEYHWRRYRARMSLDYHKRAEELMALGDLAMAEGKVDQAYRWFAEAADLETEALARIPVERTRTRAAVAMSAVSLSARAKYQKGETR